MDSTLTDLFPPLKQIFGYTSFRPDQETIVRAILDRRDVFAVMPTGGGKSLCYQLPAHIMDGTCVVISPLISLMKDQVDAARDNGLRAEFLNSTLSSRAQWTVFEKLKTRQIDLLYLSPERLHMENFADTLKSVPLCFFAIDEAHCISEWGHDFRPDYLLLSNLIQTFPGVPVAAFTATATAQVQNDIVKKLGLRSPHTVRASFNRPNLFYQVVPKAGVEQQILEFIKLRPQESGIVYRTTRSSVEKTAEYLADNGLKALPYHAGLDHEIRQKNQEAFNRDTIQVIVATIAFGMGIDKSNVRFVVHGDLPKNIEGYYQETGRAGRDGEPAHCLLFFGRGDIPKIRFFIEQIEDENEKRYAIKKLGETVGFASVNSCRRRQLLSYFGEKYEGENCGGCDVCAGTVERADATTDAQICLSAVVRTGGRFGAGHIIDVVTGAKTQRILDLHHNEIKTYGAGRAHPKLYWRRLIDELIGQECLVSTGDKYPVLQVSAKGSDVLYGKIPFLILNQVVAETRKKKQFAVYEESNPQLFKELRAIRKRLADEHNVPPFVVFSDRTLHEMCIYFPATPAALLEISGVGEHKLKQYGAVFLESIAAFVRANPSVVPLKRQSPTAIVREKTAKPSSGLTDTLAETKKLVEQGMSYMAIAAARGLSPGTIVQHLDEGIQLGWQVDIDNHVGAAKRIEIERLFAVHDTGRLKPVVEAGNGAFSYDEARLVRAVLMRPEH